jgi:hypothetical protein
MKDNIIKSQPLSLRGTKQARNYTAGIEKFETRIAEMHSYEFAALSLAMTKFGFVLNIFLSKFNS